MFSWIDFLAPGAVAHAVLAFSIVVALGLALGSVGFRGARLGTAGVLFAGLFLGQAGLHIDQSILEFARDFGLILFVYTVGTTSWTEFFLIFEAARLGAQRVRGGDCFIRRPNRDRLSLPAQLLFAGSCGSLFGRYYKYAELGCGPSSAPDGKSSTCRQ